MATIEGYLENQSPVALDESRESARSRTASDGKFHIPCLDGIRAISFLIVFVAHAGYLYLIPGGFGVTVFFFLSGYLITTLLRMEFAKKGGISLSSFYIRRVCRIFPPLYLTLLFGLGVVAIGLVKGVIYPRAVAFAVMHLTNYFNIYSTERLPADMGVLWSLAVEEHFYAVFPLAYLWMNRIGYSRRRQAAILTSVCATVLIWRSILVVVYGASSVRVYGGTDTRIDSILIGCIMAIILNPMMGDANLLSRSRLRLGATLGMLILLFTFTDRNVLFRDTLRYTIQGIGLFLIFVFVVKCSDTPSVRWLDWKPLRYMGMISYTLYLVHNVFLNFVKQWVGDNRLEKIVFGLALSTLFATLMYYYVEKPAAVLRSRLLARYRPDLVVVRG
jgi:peptidoglycan/LPS O-acetylase OafA/YrhL